MRSMLPVAILAGGLATRLRPLTEMIPKSLLEIAGEPFLAHQLRLLKSRGIHRVVLCVGYLGGMVRDFAGNGESGGRASARSVSTTSGIPMRRTRCRPGFIRRL